MTEPSSVPIREHIEALAAERAARLEGLWNAHQAVHDQEAIARSEAARRIDARLADLNELRQEVVTDRGRLVMRETFEAKLETLEGRIDTLHDQITEWRGREKGLSLVGSLALGAAGFVATILAIYFALN